MRAPGDEFVGVAGFNLEGDRRSFAVDDPRRDVDLLAEGRRGEMSEVYFCANGSLVWLKAGGDGFPGGLLNECDQLRCAQHCGHTVTGEGDGMLLLNDEGLMALGACLGF